MKKCEIKTKVSRPQGECGEEHKFSVKFSARVSIAINSDEFCIFRIFHEFG